MSAPRILPSEQLNALGGLPAPLHIERVALDWLARPEELYGLPNEERNVLSHALYSSGMGHIVTDLHDACLKVHERQSTVIESRARVSAALKNPQGLFELPDEEWRSLLQIAMHGGGVIASRQLVAARNQIRDGQPAVVDAHHAVTAALASPEFILACNRKEWTRLLKTADAVPRDFNGQYNDFRRKLIQAKTNALIASRIAQTPSSSIKHLGIRGSLDLAFVRKIDQVIQTNWLTVPRLHFSGNRKEICYENGIPQANICRCDSKWGDCYGIPSGLNRGTTSIICDLNSASLLKIFGMTVFDVNVSPELESYFRSLEAFPWEQAVGGGAA